MVTRLNFIKTSDNHKWDPKKEIIKDVSLLLDDNLIKTLLIHLMSLNGTSKRKVLRKLYRKFSHMMTYNGTPKGKLFGTLASDELKKGTPKKFLLRMLYGTLLDPKRQIYYEH